MVTIEVNGERYFTVKQFAEATKRSEQNIRFLMSYGNRIRKLKTVYIAGKPLIPYSELTEYPFTLPGRNSTEIYHYNEKGNVVSEDIREVQNQSIHPSTKSL